MGMELQETQSVSVIRLLLLGFSKQSAWLHNVPSSTTVVLNPHQSSPLNGAINLFYPPHTFWTC